MLQHILEIETILTVFLITRKTNVKTNIGCDRLRLWTNADGKHLGTTLNIVTSFFGGEKRTYLDFCKINFITKIIIIF